MSEPPELDEWLDGCAAGYYRTTAVLNVRATPGGDVIGVWRAGETVVAWFRVGEWWFVTGPTADDGRAGFSHGSFLIPLGVEMPRGLDTEGTLRERAIRAASCLRARLSDGHGHNRSEQCGHSGVPSQGQNGPAALAG